MQVLPSGINEEIKIQRYSNMQLIRSDAIIGSPTSQGSAIQYVVRTSTDGTRSGRAQADT